MALSLTPRVRAFLGVLIGLGVAIGVGSIVALASAGVGGPARAARRWDALRSAAVAR